VKITRVLDANPGEPEKLDITESSVGNAKAFSTLCCTHKAGSRECRVELHRVRIVALPLARTRVAV
jgi:hypothetical protein